MAKIRCLTCSFVVEEIPRQNSGCTCDPDAPTWCAILSGGRIFGLSQARFEIVEPSHTDD
jgi:hypothetical protein